VRLHTTVVHFSSRSNGEVGSPAAGAVSRAPAPSSCGVAKDSGHGEHPRMAPGGRALRGTRRPGEGALKAEAGGVRAQPR
jgi:hypothetical protein